MRCEGRGTLLTAGTDQFSLHKRLNVSPAKRFRLGKVAKPADLSSNLRIHMAEGEN